MIVLMDFVVYIGLALLGVCMGSFAGATVWRLRARQLDQDKKQRQPYDKKEYNRLKKLLGKDALRDRSQCLSCGYELRWYDLIPVVSWLSLRGKCRHCREKIGSIELIMELGMAAFFVLSFLLWPAGLETGLQVAHFALWLLAGVVMAVLFAYDSKWFLLPDSFSLALAIVGAGVTTVVALESGDVLGTVLSAVGAVAILSGLYLVLYLLSRGRWVGFGDVKLGVGLALLLADWRLGFVALFMANFIGCLIVIPLMMAGKLKRNAQVPFGPLLILGTIVAAIVGGPIVDAYLTIGI